MKALETMRYIAPILYFMLCVGCANEQVQIAEAWEAEARILEAEAEAEKLAEIVREIADEGGLAEHLGDWAEDWTISNVERSWRLWRVEWEESSQAWMEKATAKRLEASERVVEALRMGNEQEARIRAAYAQVNDAELSEEYQQRLKEEEETFSGNLEGFDWASDVEYIKVYSSEAEARAAAAKAEAWEAVAEAWEEKTETEARAATAEARAANMAFCETQTETILSEYLFYGQWRLERAEQEAAACKAAKAAWTIAAKAWEVSQEAEAWAIQAEAEAAGVRVAAVEGEAAAEAWEAAAEAWKEKTEAEARAATAEAFGRAAAAKAWEAAATTWNAVAEDLGS